MSTAESTVSAFDTTASETLTETTDVNETCGPDTLEELNRMCRNYVGKDLDTFIQCVNESNAGIHISENGRVVSFSDNGIKYSANLDMESLLCGSDMSSLVPKPDGCTANLCCDNTESVSNTLASAVMKLNECANNKIKEGIQAEVDKLSFFKRKCAQASLNNWDTESGLIHGEIANQLKGALDKECSKDCSNGRPNNCDQVETTSVGVMSVRTAAGPIGYYRVSARNLDARCMDDDCVCAQAGDNCACDGRLVDCESLY